MSSGNGARCGLQVCSLVQARRSLAPPPDCESASNESLHANCENISTAARQPGAHDGTRPQDGRSSSDSPHCRTRWVNCLTHRKPDSSAEHAARARASCVPVSVSPKAAGSHETPRTDASNCCTAAWQAIEHWRVTDGITSGFGRSKQAAASSTARGAWSLHPPRQTARMDSRYAPSWAAHALEHPDAWPASNSGAHAATRLEASSAAPAADAPTPHAPSRSHSPRVIRPTGPSITPSPRPAASWYSDQQASLRTRDSAAAHWSEHPHGASEAHAALTRPSSSACTPVGSEHQCGHAASADASLDGPRVATTVSAHACDRMA
eukprot:scaffold9367_cov90-Isochrysis_galbana.AAC.1